MRVRLRSIKPKMSAQYPCFFFSSAGACDTVIAVANQGDKDEVIQKLCTQGSSERCPRLTQNPINLSGAKVEHRDAYTGNEAKARAQRTKSEVKSTRSSRRRWISGVQSINAPPQDCECMYVSESTHETKCNSHA